MKDQLDELNKGDIFKGFSPRWMLPTTLRNTGNPNLNTSCLLVVIDSAREKDLELVPYFNNEVIGDNEILVAQTALKHLEIKHDRKEKIEVFFDVQAILGMFG